MENTVNILIPNMEIVDKKELMMKVLVTGVNGQLGHDIVLACERRRIDVIGINSSDLDITVLDDVDSFLEKTKATVLVHCAAYTAVDQAEVEKEKCFKVNVDGTRNLAMACRRLEITMVYFSTDYVFSGTGELPWEENDKKKPLNIYGQSKSEGENIVQEILDSYFILRLSWVFGLNGNNFVKTMLKLGREKEEVRVVNDQFGSPTYTEDVAEWTLNIIYTREYGIYHVASEGICSWYEFTCEIFRQADLKTPVIPVSSSEFPTKAVRPRNSRLSKKKLIDKGFEPLPAWQDSLKRFLCLIDIQKSDVTDKEDYLS